LVGKEEAFNFNHQEDRRRKKEERVLYSSPSHVPEGNATPPAQRKPTKGRPPSNATFVVDRWREDGNLELSLEGGYTKKRGKKENASDFSRPPTAEGERERFYGSMGEGGSTKKREKKKGGGERPRLLNGRTRRRG